MKPRRESTARLRLAATTNQIMIRYGNTPCAPYTPTQSAHSGTCTIRAIFNPAKRSLATSERLVFDIKTSIFIYSDLHGSQTSSFGQTAGRKFTFICDLSSAPLPKPQRKRTLLCLWGTISHVLFKGISIFRRV